MRSIKQTPNHINISLLILLLLPLLIIEPLLSSPGLPAGADFPIHLYRTMEYERAWGGEGVIIPRWAPNLAYGYGYPLFVFAPPLPYMLGVVFHALGFSFEVALKILLILTLWLYAGGMYLLVRDLLQSEAAGLVAGVAYAFAPFALREALLYGGNVPQFLAIGLFPWILWAMARAPRSLNWGIVAAFLYAALILSHLFQALIFTPVAALFALCLAATDTGPAPDFEQTKGYPPESPWCLPQFRDAPIYSLMRALAPLMLGLLLSAFFWLPAAVEREFTRAQADIYLAKSPFFVRYPHWSELIAWIEPLDARAVNPYVPLSLGVVTLTLAALGLFYSPFTIRQLPCSLLLGLVAGGAVLMTLPVSRPVWEAVTILQVAEFPWRMLGLANLGLAFWAGGAVLWLPSPWRGLFVIACVPAQILAVAPLLYPVTPFIQYGQSGIADQIGYERRSQSIGTTTLGEYLPQTVSEPPTGSPLVAEFEAGRYPERLDRTSLTAGATATLLTQSGTTHAYRLDMPVAFTVRFFQFDYPGWRATLDGEPIPIRPEVDTGLILLEIPPGQHHLTLHFGETPIRLAGLALTLVGVLGAALRTILPFGRATGSENGRLVVTKARGWSLPLLAIFLLLVVALWLKPLLRPRFTLESPPGAALPAQHPSSINFAHGIRLIGYDLEQNVVSAGGELQVVLYWETDTPINANLQPFVHLDRLDDGSTVANATNYTPGDTTTESVIPTFHWDTARYVRDEHDLIVPPDVPPIAYALRVGLIWPEKGLLPLADGSGDTASLTVINVTSDAPEKELYLFKSLNASFSDGSDAIQLTNFKVDPPTPEQVEFTLAWRAEQPPTADYIIFAQLLDAEQKLVASFDAPPLNGAYPTSTWLAGQTILDPRHIPLAGVPSGEYRLIVGLYEPATQRRLRTPGGADFVELTTLQVVK